MSEMVERVARAYDEVLSRWGVRLIDPKLRDEMCRAAILAMREPTEGMDYAAENAAAESNNVSEIWQAGIAEALK